MNWLTTSWSVRLYDGHTDQLPATYTVTIELRPGIAWTTSKPVRIRPHERSFLKHDGMVDFSVFEITAA